MHKLNKYKSKTIKMKTSQELGRGSGFHGYPVSSSVHRPSPQDRKREGEPQRLVLGGGRAQWSALVEDVTVYMTRLRGIVKQLLEPASTLSAFTGWVVNRENRAASLGHQGMTEK